MKKFISFVSILLMLSITFSLAGCSAKEPVGDPPEANGQDYFNAEVLDVLDNQIKVRCLDVTTGAITEGTELSVTTKVSSANEVPEMEVGDHIRVVFTGVMETDPPRLQTVFSIWKIDENGEVLSGASFPQPIEPEKADWGITLSVKDVTPTGMTLVCSQSGGEITGELQCGSDYSLLVNSNGVWNAVPYLVDEVAWTSEAYYSPMNDSIEFELKWERLYGELPAGTYRVVKGFMDFRGTGDYDTETYHTEFEITE